MRGHVGRAAGSLACQRTFLGTGRGVQGLRAHPLQNHPFSLAAQGLACLASREPLAFRQTFPTSATAGELPWPSNFPRCLTPTKRSSPICRPRRSQYHHDKHHQAYVDMLNKLLPGSGFEGMELEADRQGELRQEPGIFNNAGQDFNHIHFWPWMKKGGGGKKAAGIGARADRPRSRRLRQVPQRRSSRRARRSSARAGAGSRSRTASSK